MRTAVKAADKGAASGAHRKNLEEHARRAHRARVCRLAPHARGRGARGARRKKLAERPGVACLHP